MQSARTIAIVLRALLVVATLAAYQPVWHAGFIWDDDFYVTQNSTLHDLDGLRRIWFQVGAVPQYYPLVHTVFWVEHHLWGIEPLGYHVVNVLLHALGALLLAQVLLYLRVPGAWLAAFIFALHPVCVETVAWITELKNVLSTVLYLTAALAYWRFEELREAGDEQRRAWYAVALVAFGGALLSKTVTCSLPAALLLVRWWRTGRLRSADVVPLVPFFAVGVALGLQTAWIERHGLGAQGTYWSLSVAQRCLVAGRVLWFYASSLFWPANLVFIYPRWNVSTAVWWQWLFPLAAVGLVVALWLVRARIGRGLLTAILFFAGTLGPALGFINVYPMRYSFVADHFQYLASIGLITLAAAAISRSFDILRRRGRFLPAGLTGGLLVMLGVLTWRQSATYANVETLWLTTLRANPNCSMCHNNLGNILLGKGRTDEAFVHFQRAVDIEPENAEAHNSVGFVLLQKGQVDEAMAHFHKALDVRPDLALTYYNLGTALMQKGQVDEAIAQFQKAVERQPDYVVAHNSLGIALLQQGHAREAAAHFETAVKIQPNEAVAHNNLGTVFLQSGQMDQAIAEYQRALQLRPDFAEAADNLRYVAWVLATSPDLSLRNGEKAVELAQQADRLSGNSNPATVATLAAAYAEARRFPEAIAAAQRAVQLATAAHNTALAEELEQHLRRYESGLPAAP